MLPNLQHQAYSAAKMNVFLRQRVLYAVISQSCLTSFRKGNIPLRPVTKRLISTYKPDFDPYAYTSGRWLKDDQQQHDARYIKFDFDRLCQKVIGLSPDADRVVDCKKLEGGDNRMFIFSLDNGKRVVARLRFPCSGPRALTTASEVATMKYLQKHTSIPIPDVLDWSNDTSNALGYEYIIMNHAGGVQLHSKWPGMSGHERTKCIGAIYETLKDLQKLKFPAYGSLHFADGIGGNSIRLQDHDFCIGPSCRQRYWDSTYPQYFARVEPNRGPWSDLDDFCDGLVDTGISRVPVRDDGKRRPSYHGSIEDHVKMVMRTRLVLRAIAADPRVQDSAMPTLFHDYVGKGDIFVSEHDPAVITGVIDWQFSSIEPAFWYTSSVPDWAKESFAASSNAENKQQEQKTTELCKESWEVCTKHFLPSIAKPQSMEANIFRPFFLCHNTWKDGAVFLRHELIESAKDWNDHLGFSGSSPFPTPTAKEKEKHKKEYEFFKDTRSLRGEMASLFKATYDGWVFPEVYDLAMDMQKDLYMSLVETALDPKNYDPNEPLKDEEDIRAVWPYDV